MFLLLLLPVLLMLAFFVWNMQLLDQQVGAQQAVTDACALAAAQALVEDRMLYGTGQNVIDLQLGAAATAHYYSQHNTLWPGKGPASQVKWTESDLTFALSNNPLDAKLTWIDSITLKGQRAKFTENAVPMLGGGLLAVPTMDLVTVSTALLDRGVSGLRPVFQKNVPLVPIAIQIQPWSEQVESTSPPGKLVVELKLPEVALLQIGVTTQSALMEQVLNGVTATQLKQDFAKFEIHPDLGLSVSQFPAADAAELKAALSKLAEQKSPRIWPLFEGMTDDKVNLVKLIAARLVSVGDISDESSGNLLGLTITLQPTFFSSPSVMTAAGRAPNPYLCRVHLTK